MAEPSSKAITEAALSEALDDFERVRLCMYVPKGWEKRALETRTSSGELTKPMPGMYVRTAYWDSLDRAEKMVHVVRTAALSHSGWIVSYASAALLYGADVPHALLWPIHYTTPYSGGGRSAKYFKHHRGSADRVSVDGIYVTSAARTVVDCAREYPFAYALAIADSFRHKGLVDDAALESELAAASGMRGIKAARSVVELSSPLPSNGGESQVRALMMELRLPIPELQAPVADLEQPGKKYYVDFMFTLEDGTKVAFELDGLQKYTDVEMTKGRYAVQVMRDERQREAAITAHGIRVVRMSFEQATDPEFLLRRLAVYGVVPQA